MECNKDEAIRAKEIAERRITEKDYLGAKKFALKAQNLYPQLDGLTQVLMTIDVYISAENKISGEVDWYGILGVDPWAGDDTVRKQYRKLALGLHPDKNKCKGADGAFKLVSEAWGLLSDKAKRLAYNQKRSSKGVQQRFPTQSGVPPHQPTSNGFQNSQHNVTSNVRVRTKDNTRVDSSPFSSLNQKPNTFWTICNRCRTQYEYLRIYLNQTLLCPNCREAFVAVEKAPPPSVLRPVSHPSHQQHQNARHHTANRDPYGTSGRDSSSRHHPTNNRSSQWDSFSRMTGVSNKNATAQAASVVQQAHERVKRGLEASQEWDAARRMADSGLKTERIVKKPRPDYVPTDGSYAGNWGHQSSVGMGNRFRSFSDPARGHFDMPNISGSAGYSNIVNRMLSTYEVRNVLQRKAHAHILKKLQDLISETEGKDKAKEREKKSMKPKSKASSEESEGVENCGSSAIKEISHNSDVESHEAGTIAVPDSDFHNFDLDRSESSFEDDQVWAAYDDDDSMPRFYARIQKVVSLNPFKMKISWLNSRSNSELGPINWIGSGFAKTCGDFRTGKYEYTNTLNAFSHRVKFTKGVRGIIRIFPRKGDVWALYRKWSPDWDRNTPDEVIHKYDMVEVLDDYTHDEQGVTVMPLDKVVGFRAVFRKSTDPDGLRRIPKEEMFRFSHQVPNYILTGHEADNAPEGCRELDPAATPLELLSDNAGGEESAKMDNGETEKLEERSRNGCGVDNSERW